MRVRVRLFVVAGLAAVVTAVFEPVREARRLWELSQPQTFMDFDALSGRSGEAGDATTVAPQTRDSRGATRAEASDIPGRSLNAFLAPTIPADLGPSGEGHLSLPGVSAPPDVRGAAHDEGLAGPLVGASRHRAADGLPAAVSLNSAGRALTACNGAPRPAEGV